LTKDFCDMDKINHLCVLIKPVSGNCNLRCKYCFYRDEIKHREKRHGIMSVDTLEKIIKNLLTSCRQSCVIGFQGGEPLLAGLPFFRKVIELGKKYNTGNIKVFYTVQTNGTLIDSEWANFFAENDVLVGLSLDGTKTIHERWRGKGTYEKVLHAAELLNEAGAQYNILSVVTADMARSIKEVYSDYKRRGFRYLQFINCLDPLGEPPGQHEYSLTPDLYAGFLKTLFDLWYQDLMDGCNIYIREFNNIAGRFAGGRPESCNQNGFCSMQNVIEADGSGYPCDFYVLDSNRIGNFARENAVELFKRGNDSQFIKSSFERCAECKRCIYFGLCRGGCRRERKIGRAHV
jgi:uncharacterized protein